MVKQLKDFATSAAGQVWAQLSLMAVPLLFAGLLWFIVNWANDSKSFDQAQLTAISAVNAQISAFVARLDGDLRTQAAIDANQNYRIEQAELDLADDESRIRLLELWRTNVINRDGPL